MTADGCPQCGGSDLRAGIRVDQRKYLACGTCGVVFVHEAAGGAPGDEYYRRGDYHARFQEEGLASRRAIFEAAMDRIESAGQRGRLLDVGCSTGGLLEVARERGWQAEGVEISLPAAAKAMKSGFKVFTQELTSLSLPERHYEAVAFVNSLDHTRAPFSTLVGARRLLREKGVLYIRMPNYRFHALLWPLLRSVGMGHWLVFHSFCYTPMALRRSIERAGFRVLSVQPSAISSGDAYGLGGGTWLGVSVARGVALALAALGRVVLSDPAFAPSMDALAVREG